MKQRSALIVILLLSAVLRLVSLDKYPAGFTPDEASFGYDAFSILKTGKDQWGRFLPLFLESFGDFKPPLYAYLTIPSIAIFGLTKFATRFPNALVGVSAVYATYLLVKELGSFKKNQFVVGNQQLLAGVAALLLAISPWHIQMSRGAFEANLTTFFLPSGVYLFLKGLKKNKYLVWSSVIFGLNLFSYHSARFVVPSFIIFLAFIFWRDLVKLKRKGLYLSLIVFLAFIFASFYTYTQGAGRRVSDVSVFRGALEAQAEARLAAIEAGMNPVVARILHNKYQIAVDRFLGNYRQYFSSKFLFKDGSGEATYGMVPGIGVLYWLELPLLTGFIIMLFKNRGQALLIIFFWILVSFVPASLTTGVGFAGNRAAVAMPAFQIAEAFGFWGIYEILKTKLPGRLLAACFTAVFLVLFTFFLLFLRDYFFAGSYKLARGMLFGNLEVAYWLILNDQEKNEVVVSRKLSEPHIYIAFASAWDPKDYQRNTASWIRYKESGLTFLDQLESYGLNKYVFRNIKDSDFQLAQDTFFVGKPDEFPQGIDVIKRFVYPDGDPAILIAAYFKEIYAQKIY